MTQFNYQDTPLYAELLKLVPQHISQEELDTEWDRLMGHELESEEVDLECTDLLAAFIWDETPQGTEYWMNLAHNLDDLSY